MSNSIEISYGPPEPEEYNSLRVAAGLSPKDLEGSKTGLQNSLFIVVLREANKLVGMGRVVGDGGCFFHIVDIAVDPDYQGKGLGKRIMSELVNYLDETAPNILQEYIVTSCQYEQLSYNN